MRDPSKDPESVSIAIETPANLEEKIFRSIENERANPHSENRF